MLFILLTISISGILQFEMGQRCPPNHRLAEWGDLFLLSIAQLTKLDWPIALVTCCVAKKGYSYYADWD